MVRLVFPTKTSKDTYLAGMQELQESGIALNYDLARASENFDEFLDLLQSYDDVTKIPAGYVPCLRLWLMDDETFVGNVTIRHWLNEGIRNRGHVGYEIVPSQRRKGYGKRALELALLFIDEVHIVDGPVEVSCKETNEGSRRIIESCGGKLLRAEDGLLVYVMPPV